jgi:transposase InsO family protein
MLPTLHLGAIYRVVRGGPRTPLPAHDSLARIVGSGVKPGPARVLALRRHVRGLFKAGRPGSAVVADPTEVSTWEARSSAVVLDCFSRCVVGWAMAEPSAQSSWSRRLRWRSCAASPPRVSSTIPTRARSTCRSLWPALAPGRHRHLDGSDGLRARQRGLRIVLRPAQEGTHPPALLARRSEPRSAIFEWIEAWYNPRRLHSTLGYLPPHNYSNCSWTRGRWRRKLPSP